jgi:hypothetical protein
MSNDISYELIMGLNTKKPSKLFLTVLLNLKKVYASKSKTNDGNKPNAILSTIAITATA